MMHKHGGYRIVFYGVEGSEVVADEVVTVLTERERARIYGPLDSFASQFFKHDGRDEAYTIFKKNATREILQRVGEGDILCNPMGNYYEELCKPVSQGGVEVANGQPFLVESGIGYDGILLNTHRVFESEAWRHYVYGMYKTWTQNKYFVDGDFYDTVIPNFYDPDHYEHRKSREDYYFMNCRIAQRKGIDIAKATMEATGDKLIIAGQPGENVDMNSPNVEYIGYVTEKEKIDLLAHAKGLFSTTKYIGPFEGVAVEAQMSGTPVITTDFGCYTETVNHGVTGYRGMVLKDFVKAVKAINAGRISSKACRQWAVNRYSTRAVAPMYDRYFKKLEDLWGAGWSAL
jgi:glycosyltransferase involved in cell wall biosynthesis